MVISTNIFCSDVSAGSGVYLKRCSSLFRYDDHHWRSDWVKPEEVNFGMSFFSLSMSSLAWIGGTKSGMPDGRDWREETKCSCNYSFIWLSIVDIPLAQGLLSLSSSHGAISCNEVGLSLNHLFSDERCGDGSGCGGGQCEVPAMPLRQRAHPKQHHF